MNPDQLIEKRESYHLASVLHAQCPAQILTLLAETLANTKPQLNYGSLLINLLNGSLVNGVLDDGLLGPDDEVS